LSKPPPHPVTAIGAYACNMGKFLLCKTELSLLNS
jgi:hypothetical protein